MSTSALRRTLRRCTAVLLVPISLWIVVFVDWLHTTRAGGFLRPALALGNEAALLLLLGACGYLLASFAATLLRGPSSAAGDAGEGPGKVE